MGAVAIAITRGNVGTSTLVDVAWAVADATGINLANTVVFVVANVIFIDVFALALLASTLVDLAWAVADATGINLANAVVQLITDTVGIQVVDAIAFAVEASFRILTTFVDVGCGIVIAGRHVGASRNAKLTRTIVVQRFRIVVQGSIGGATSASP